MSSRAPATAVVDPRGWSGQIGLRALTDEETRLCAVQLHRSLRLTERQELVAVRKALTEMHALYRAWLRTKIEGAQGPLDVVKLQAEELVHDGLPLDCLNPDDLIRIHKIDPEWSPWGRT